MNNDNFIAEMDSSQSSLRSNTYINENVSNAYISRQVIFGSVILICSAINLIILYYSPKMRILNHIVVILGGISCAISIALLMLFGILLFSIKTRYKEIALSKAKYLKVISFLPLMLYIAICVISIKTQSINAYMAVVYHIFSGIQAGIMGSTFNYAYLYWMQILQVELPDFHQDDVLKQYQ